MSRTVKVKMTRANKVNRSSKLIRLNRSRLNTIGASATLLFALSLSVANLAGAAPQKVVPVAKIAVHHTRISPPHAGVKLLEDILSRMRNLPQIAMTKNKQSFQYQQAQQSSVPQGATDQLLAIRPKEKSDKKRTIAMAEPRPADSFSSSRAKDSGRLDDAKTLAGADTLRRASHGARSYERESLAAGKLAQQQVRGGMISGLPSSSMGAYTPNAFNAANTKGIQNFDAYAKEITDRLSPESRQMMTASTRNLFNATKKLEEAQQIAQNMGKQSAGGGGSGYANTRNQIVADERHAPGGSFRSEAKQAKVISTNPLITEYDKNNAAAGAGASSAAGDDDSGSMLADKEKAADKPQQIARALPAPAAPMSMPFGAGNESSPAAQKPPAEPSLFKHVREFLNRDGSSIAGASRPLAEGAEKNKPIEVALLPPSVVTGIPLVRLGTSESETNKALAGKGSLNKTKVNEWSVWSLQKPGNDDVSLQIYARNGQVEAIRIFDPSLISPEFGVKLGDELSTVKQRFGEPAFILSEPQSRGGQNYVYPISQVSFQLAMANRTSAPKVVSLLIFNAK